MNDGGRRGYSSPLRAEQAAATRERIVDATVELLQGVDAGAFGMQDVADRAGVSLRTVYRAFPTKDDLLGGVLAMIQARFDEIAGGPPTTRAEFDASVGDAVRAVYELEPLYRALFATVAGREAHRAAGARRQASLQEGFADELAGLPDEQVRRIVSVLHLLSSARSVLWLKDYAGLDVEQATATVEWALRAVARAAREEER